MGRNFAGYVFERVGTIHPKRDVRGLPVEERPRSPNNSPPHKYGSGPFCRFHIAQEGRWRHSGVYVITCGDTVRYVGECKNLAMICNYVGGITPSAVKYKGGQQTHCRINNLILDEAKRGVETVLWFHTVWDSAHRKARKGQVATALNPTWNLTSTRKPRSSPPRARVPARAHAGPNTASGTSPIRRQGDAATQRRIAGLSFSYVGAIRPQRDRRGEVVGELPQSKFRNERNLRLHKYGRGPFCRFRVAQGWQRGGVYILTNGDAPLYVGECQNVEDRWGTNGYGAISPRNCYIGGQETNCRINSLIYRGIKTGARFDLWFHPIVGDKQTRLAVESKLVTALRPPWNR